MPIALQKPGFFPKTRFLKSPGSITTLIAQRMKVTDVRRGLLVGDGGFGDKVRLAADVEADVADGLLVGDEGW